MSEASEPLSRRAYLTAVACLHGANLWDAIEAVSSVAIEHPDWDMDEKRTWVEWARGASR